MQAPLQVWLLADGPAPPLLLCWVRASRRQVTEKPTLNHKKRWKPSPHHRQQQDRPLTVFLKDVGGSKTFLLLKTASWLGWTKMQNFAHQAVESSKCRAAGRIGEVQAKYRVVLADFVQTYDPHRHGGAFPANLLKTKLQFGRVQTYHLRVS